METNVSIRPGQAWRRPGARDLRAFAAYWYWYQAPWIRATWIIYYLDFGVRLGGCGSTPGHGVGGCGSGRRRRARKRVGGMGRGQPPPLGLNTRPGIHRFRRQAAPSASPGPRSEDGVCEQEVVPHFILCAQRPPGLCIARRCGGNGGG